MFSYVTHEQVRVLFTAMEHNESLEYIDLGDNGITDEGVTYIADLLQALQNVFSYYRMCSLTIECVTTASQTRV